MTRVYSGNTIANDVDSYISIQSSTFTNLNAQTNVTALADFEGKTPLK